MGFGVGAAVGGILPHMDVVVNDLARREIPARHAERVDIAEMREDVPHRQVRRYSKRRSACELMQDVQRLALRIGPLIEFAAAHLGRLLTYRAPGQGGVAMWQPARPDYRAPGDSGCF